MSTQNPFVDNPDVAEIWELGYVAGFAEPEIDHFLPISEELLESYQLGEQAGRDDRRRLPPQSQEEGGQEGESVWGELLEIGIIHALGEGLQHLGVKAGGLISLVLEVIQIPGDVSLTTLEPEWEGPVDQEGDTYVALCGRTDHTMLFEETITSDGYWIGPQRTTFSDAVADRNNHEHPESIIVRCSTTDGTCGPVWPVQ
jgi:hypothetical protein